MEMNQQYIFNCKYLRHLRVQEKIEPWLLAEALGVHRNAVWLVENGRNQPTLDLITKIAVLFEVPIDKLIINSTVKTCWKCGSTEHVYPKKYQWASKDLCAKCALEV